MFDEAFILTCLFSKIGLIIAEVEAHIDEVRQHMQYLLLLPLFCYHIRCKITIIVVIMSLLLCIGQH